MHIHWIPIFGYVWELKSFSWAIQYNADGEILKGWKPEHLNIIPIQFRSNNTLSSSLPTLTNLTMVFTVAVSTVFFCAPNQMGLVNNVWFAFVDNRIVSVNDLADFCKNHWHQVVKNLKYPATLPDPNNNGQFVRSPRSHWEPSPLNV